MADSEAQQSKPGAQGRGRGRREPQGRADEPRDTDTGTAQEEEVQASYVPDASNYKVQPTSYRLPPNAQTRGGVPDMRFTEEVLAGGEEDTGGGEDAHPPENQPLYGISEDDDELPDTTGRAALREQKRER